MKLLKIVGLASLAYSSQLAHAGEWTAEGTITGVYIDLRQSTEAVLFRHSSLPRKGDSCSNNANYYELKSDSNLSNKAYSMLLSAEARQENVLVYVEGCGTNGNPLVTIVENVNVTK